MSTVEPCNNTSVGVVAVCDRTLLLIERANPPYGWAPPAGHVEDGEPYRVAAARELWEEVGLEIDPYRLRYLTSSQVDNQCCRPKGLWHYWEVYEAPASAVTRVARRSEEETSAMAWVGFDRLDELMAVSAHHLATGADSEVWRAQPGLEPVWMTLLGNMGMLSAGIVDGRLTVNPAWFYARLP